MGEKPEGITVRDVKKAMDYVVKGRARGLWLKPEYYNDPFSEILKAIEKNYDPPSSFRKLPEDEIVAIEVAEKYIKWMEIAEEKEEDELFNKKTPTFEEAIYWSGIADIGPFGKENRKE